MPAGDLPQTYGVTFRLASFKWPDRAWATERLQILLDAHTAIQRAYLRRHPVGSPYQAGVRYIREPANEEEWEEIGVQLAHGGADCEDLACWLAAHLQLSGVRARAVPIAQPLPLDDGSLGILFHIVVRTPKGTLDPSRDLGMKGSA